MAVFVLVHGSHDGGWVWQKVAHLLRRSGQVVYSPTLTGMADRSHLVNCGVNLTTHILDVTSLLFYEDLTDVILVGNSYAGMVITGVAAKMPERLRLLVYLDAYVPEGGQSEADLWPADMRASREADASAHGGVTQAPPPAVFGVTDPVLSEWINARETPHPFATYTEPVPRGNERSAALPRVFIRCTGNPAAVQDLFAPFAIKAKAQGWDVREIPENHIAMLTAPDRVAEIFLELASQYSRK